MYGTPSGPSPEAQQRQARIIALALLAGCVFLAAVVVLAVSLMEEPAKRLSPWIGRAAWAGALASFLTSFGIHPMLLRRGPLPATVVALAINEGAVLVALALALAARELTPYVYAAAIGFAGLLLHYPTRAQFAG